MKARTTILLGLAGATLLLMVWPVHRATREANAVMDLGHIVLFGSLAVLVRRLSRGWWTRSEWLVSAGSWACVVGFGLALEVVQAAVGRHASLQDGAADALGAAAALWTVSAWNWSIPARLLSWCGGLVLVAAAAWMPTTVLVDGWYQRREWPLLASFESSREITRWQLVDCHAVLVRQHATAGQQALEIEFGTEHYACATYVWPLPDWSAYQALEFDAFLDGEKPIDFIMKMEDLRHNGRFQDRYNSNRKFQPGTNHFRIPLAEVRAGLVGREFDLHQVMRIQFFTVLLPEPRRVTFDNMRLVP